MAATNPERGGRAATPSEATGVTRASGARPEDSERGGRAATPSEATWATRLAIDARQVSKVFGSGPLAFKALQAVDFQVRLGELVMLVGPSGSGKTTLLSILGCVLRATSGEVRLFEHDVTALRESQLPKFRSAVIGFVFQGHNLISSLTARDNVAMVSRLRGRSTRAANVEARELLERVGLGDKLARHPNELSGGQRQRVAIARALAGEPPLLLADEPTAALDAKTGLEVTELLVELCRERKTTVVVVTHDNRIFHLADRIVGIEDGRILPPGLDDHHAHGIQIPGVT